ncbi:MAG: tripartite tricarboxylate transporter substrate binding protein [Pseudomonadota bacterium]
MGQVTTYTASLLAAALRLRAHAAWSQQDRPSGAFYPNRRIRLVVPFSEIIAAVLMCAAVSVFAQAYPSKPVRLVVGWPPGGAADGVARPLAIKLSEALGRTVVVDNRGGATGTIGATAVAKAAADGYTLLLGTSNELVLQPYEKMPYNSIEDFAPISTVISFPSVLVLHPSVPVSSLQQFVAFTRARPGKLNFATTGSGTSHLSGELFKQLAKVDFAYVSYKGGGPASIDLVAGHVDAMFATLPSTVSFAKNGKLRALMVTDRKRSSAAPDVPSAKEVGLGEMVLITWNGVLAPAGTSPAILDRLHKDITAVMNASEMKERMLVQAAEVATSSRAEFARIIRDDFEKWGKLKALSARN